MEKRSLAETAKKKAMMLEKIEVCYGNIRKAAIMVGITTQTHYNWLKDDLEYAEQAESRKDISFRNLREGLIEFAMNKIANGDTAVLNRMLGICLQNLPEEMRTASIHNNVRIRMGIKYVSTREEAEKLREEGEVM
jgi:hypothetical protein